MKPKGLLLFFLFLCVIRAQASGQQGNTDTTSLVKELNKVFSFAVQPYLYYSYQTVLTGNNATVLHNDCFKYGDDLYYGNEMEAVYVQDSFYIRINNARKSITISKVNMESKKNMDLLPLKKKDIQKLLRERYLISGTKNGDTGHILIQSRENRPGLPYTAIAVSYDNQTHLPALITITIQVLQPASPGLEAMLRDKGYSTASVSLPGDSTAYLSINQTQAVHFDTITAEKEKAVKMPLWTTALQYDSQSGAFSGKGIYREYEIIKTF